MKPDCCILAASMVIMVLVGGRPTRAEEPSQLAPGNAAAPAAPFRLVVSDPDRRLEFELPAPYWSHQSGSELAAATPAGCGRPAPSPNVIFVFRHKDALADVWCVQTPRTFLMRNKDDLEIVADAFKDSIRGQLGESMEILESRYDRRDGMYLYRLAFSASGAPAGGGCAGPPQGQQSRIQYLFVDYFIRPEGQDAFNVKVSCRAPADVFAELEPEIESIVAGLRYTGELAEEFFEPGAPEEKVLSREEAAKTAGGRRANYGWLVAAGLILIVWFLMRRRKQSAAG